MRAFRIAADRIGTRRWFHVRVHPDVQHLQDAAAAYRLGEDFTECCGCVHPVPEPAPNSGYAGLVRFAEDWLTPEVVAHELVHAALVVYRLNVAVDVRLGRGCFGREEQLAYIYGELYADFERRFHA